MEMSGSSGSGSSTSDSEANRATLQADVYIPLANGKRERQSESPDNSESPAAGEMDPCLPVNNKLQQSPDEIDSAPVKVKSNLKSSSTNSLSKNRKVKDSEDAGKPSQFISELEQKLRQKTGLSRIGLIVACAVIVLLLVFLIVIITLASTWPRTPHSHLFPVCTRAACLQASAQMLPKMNGSAAPCEDFWNYACGGWLKDHALPPAARSKWSQVEEMAFRNREAIRALVATLPHQTRDSSIEWKMTRLYESCMALDTIESDKYTPLRKIINQMGGWNVLREFSIHSWDYRQALQHLHALYGVSPFFKVVVVPDPRDHLRSIIQVSPAGLGLPDRSYYYRPSDSTAVTAYKRHLRDSVNYLGATSTAADRFSDETFHFEKRIAEITPPSVDLQDPTQATIVTVEKLKILAPSIPFHDILLAMFPKANIGDKTEVLMPSENYITKVSSILSTTDRGSLNNYMMWVLALHYLPYLSQEFRDTVNYFTKEMTGANEPLQRWEMCIETLQRFMGFGLAALQHEAMNEADVNAATNVVSEMFDLTRNQVRKRVEQAEWLQSELRAFKLEKIDTLELQVGFPPNLLTKEYRERYYSKLFVQKNDFFQNIQYGVEFLREIQQERLASPSEEHRWIDALSSSSSLTYVAPANKVVAPLHVLVTPAFHPQYPLSVLYGGVGVQLASAFVSAVLPWDVLYGADGKILPSDHVIVNQSALEVQGPIKFLIQDLIKLSHVSESVANRTALAAMKQIAAIRQAHLAMVAALSELPHTHQPAMEMFESDAIFFITQTQMLCSVSTVQQDDTDETISFNLKGSLLLKTVLKQLKSFTEAFSCPSSSAYYSSNICKEIL
ncbi:protein gone early isoform X2 [Zootermopsis nevadensis]|nr:protein gone early isoform X2 [Zootermopsis nevadensis]